MYSAVRVRITLYASIIFVDDYDDDDEVYDGREIVSGILTSLGRDKHLPPRRATPATLSATVDWSRRQVSECGRRALRCDILARATATSGWGECRRGVRQPSSPPVGLEAAFPVVGWVCLAGGGGGGGGVTAAIDDPTDGIYIIEAVS